MFISFLLFVGETTLKINHGDYRIFSTRALKWTTTRQKQQKKAFNFKKKKIRKKSQHSSRKIWQPVIL